MPSFVGLPVRIVRKLVHLVTGGGHKPPPPPRPADRWELRGLGDPVQPESSGHGHTHDHGYSHDHGHSHNHVAEPVPEPEPEPAPTPALEPLVITATDTPNPMARKYSMNRTVVQGRDAKSWQKPSDAEGDPLGEALFAIEGIASLFATGSFVTVIKAEATDWEAIHPAVEAALTAQFSG